MSVFRFQNLASCLPDTLNKTSYEIMQAGAVNPPDGLKALNFEHRTLNVEHRTLNFDDATLYRFYNKLTAKYRLSNDEGWNRFGKPFFKTGKVHYSMFDVHYFFPHYGSSQMTRHLPLTQPPQLRLLLRAYRRNYRTPCMEPAAWGGINR